MALPFFKWVGGKRHLLPELHKHLPTTIRTYYEPFVGGGALFFSLFSPVVERRPERAWINDRNSELIATYRMVRDAPNELIENLGVVRETYNLDPKGTYTRFVSDNPTTLTAMERAVRFLTINRGGFNGLWRVNKAGRVNTPWGKKPAIAFAPPDVIHEASRALNRYVTITSEHYGVVGWDAGPGDVIYVDPPYVPVNTTSNFASYTSQGFTEDDHEHLADTVAAWVKLGATVIVSNSDTPTVHKLYANWDIHSVTAPRRVAAKASSRGAVGEVIIVCQR